MTEIRWNENWKFWEDKDAFSLVWDVPGTAETIDLPHDAMLLKEAAPDSPGGGDAAYRFGGSYVYYKELLAPEEWQDRTVALRFEGIYQEAAVYVNSQLAARCPYGYTTFYVPLDDFLRYGAVNAIRVLVRTGDMPNSRWYSGSGIYRDVYLMTGDLLHIGETGPRVSTRELQEDALLLVETPVTNRSHRALSYELETVILDGEGLRAAEERTRLFLTAGSAETVSQRILVESPKLWSDETPNLYTLRVTLRGPDGILDQAESQFGIRTLALDAKHGLRVNGKHIKLRGACVHHDSGLLGAATYDDAEYRRVKLLKEAGFNAIRSAHNPMSQAMLRACDALGVYVMDEAFDMWTRAKTDHDYSRHFSDRWQRELEALARKDFNHPCVILYSLGNEIPEIATDHGAALGRELCRYMKALDDTRYTFASVNGVFASGDDIGAIMADVLAQAGPDGGNVNDFMTAMDTHMDAIVTHPTVSRNLEKAAAGMDLIGYNYMTARYQQDAEDYPNRVIVGSETYPPEIARNWKIIRESGNVIGDFTWTGWDYLGEAGVGIPAYQPGEGGFGAQFPAQLAYVGDFDITGFRRPASYFREIVFGLRRDPYLVVQNPARYDHPLRKTPWVISDSISSWTHRGFEGKPVVVEVYAAGDQVELLLNGKSLGRKAAGEAVGFITTFETAYAPGTLEAVSYENGAVVGRMTLKTADAATIRLQLVPEPGEELIYVPVTLTDAEGVPVTDETRTLTCQVSGDAELLGWGSGDPKPRYNYIGDTTETFHGRALAILRKRTKAGQAALTVRTAGLEASESMAW